MATLLSTDPLDALVGEDGDIVCDESTGWEVPFASGGVGIKQLIAIAIRLYLAEWFLDQDEGMPWFQEILGEKYDEGLLRKRLAERILGVPGVNTITSLVVAFDPSTRAVSVTYDVLSVFGDPVADTIAFKVGK